MYSLFVYRGSNKHIHLAILAGGDSLFECFECSLAALLGYRTEFYVYFIVVAVDDVETVAEGLEIFSIALYCVCNSSAFL